MTLSWLPASMRASSITRRRLAAVCAWCSGATAVVVVLVNAATAGQNNTRLDSREKRRPKDDDEDETPSSFQIEVNFMDKLADKPYLQTSDGENRPEAVPPTLRLLTVDVPEVARKGFKDGICRLDTTRVYPDAVVPPDVIVVQAAAAGGMVDNNNLEEDDDDDKSSKRKKKKKKNMRQRRFEVEQKAWVQNMFRCYHDGKIGVEVMESSVAQLNPKDLKRVQWLRNYVTSRQQQEEKGAAFKEEEHIVAATPSLQDELEAPWHQWAWISEVQQRIGGKVEFGAALEPCCVRSKWWWWWPSSPWRSGGSSNHSRRSEYRSTVASRRPVYEWVLFPFYYVTGRGTDPAGRDGCASGGGVNNCWASNKPHAVIANGAALHLVPSAHRLLQKTCKENNVPLYIIRDPRVWGANTHDSIGDVLRDLRKSLKARIVTQQLHQVAGTSFQRGRLFGKLEATAKWRAKDAARRADEALKRAEESSRRRKEMDWSGLDEAALEQKLIRRGVILQKRDGILGGGTTTTTHYSDALKALALRCVYGDEQVRPSKASVGDDKSKETPAEEDEETPAE